MKLTRAIFVLYLVCIFSGFVFSQEKSKDKKSEPKPVEIKANVLVRDASGNMIDDVKAENLKIFEDGVEQKITYFTKKEQLLNVGLLIDNTGSFRLLLDEAVKAGTSFKNYLAKEDEAFLIRFISSDKVQLVQDWTSNGNLLQRGLENLYIEGGQSAIIDALYISAQKILEREKQQKSTRYALILITDGEDRASFYKEAQLYELLKGTDIQIFPIIFPGNYTTKSENEIKRFINKMVLETGGTAFFVENTKKEKLEDALKSAVKSVADELRSQYVVGYTSTNPKRDGSTRKLTVQVADGEKGEKRQGFIRESFVVPKEK
jgi:Ca-activated chloride channel family protein